MVMIGMWIDKWWLDWYVSDRCSLQMGYCTYKARRVHSTTTVSITEHIAVRQVVIRRCGSCTPLHAMHPRMIGVRYQTLLVNGESSMVRIYM